MGAQTHSGPREVLPDSGQASGGPRGVRPPSPSAVTQECSRSRPGDLP